MAKHKKEVWGDPNYRKQTKGKYNQRQHAKYLNATPLPLYSP